MVFTPVQGMNLMGSAKVRGYKIASVKYLEGDERVGISWTANKVQCCN